MTAFERRCAADGHVGPRLIRLEAGPGQGKTRLVQEFWNVIATGQSYWPRHLAPVEGETDARRKWIAPPDDVQVGEGKVPWMWLGVDCDLTARGSLYGDLDRARRTLEAHLPAIFQTGVDADRLHNAPREPEVLGLRSGAGSDNTRDNKRVVRPFRGVRRRVRKPHRMDR